MPCHLPASCHVPAARRARPYGVRVEARRAERPDRDPHATAVGMHAIGGNARFKVVHSLSRWQLTTVPLERYSRA